MMAVGAMGGDLFDAFRESGELDDTYVFFTSDNGFHLGQHRLGAGKWTAYAGEIRRPPVGRCPGRPAGASRPRAPVERRRRAGEWAAYEEDIRVPLGVRGPGVPEGEKLPHMVLNNDLAPTFADLAGVDPPKFVDGRSLAPLLAETPPPS